MAVFVGGSNRGVAQRVTYKKHRRAFVERVRGVGMAQPVRRYGRLPSSNLDTCSSRSRVYNPVYLGLVEGPASLTRDEHRRIIASTPAQSDQLQIRFLTQEDLARLAAGALQRGEAEGEHRMRLTWHQASSTFRSSVLKLLAQWPTPLDAQVIEAKDWNRLAQVKDTACRVLDEYQRVRHGMGEQVVDAAPPPRKAGLT